MNNQVPKCVTPARASSILGMTEAELSRISKESGVGPGGARRQLGRNVLLLRGIAADLHGRDKPRCGQPTKSYAELSCGAHPKLKRRVIRQKEERWRPV